MKGTKFLIVFLFVQLSIAYPHLGGDEQTSKSAKLITTQATTKAQAAKIEGTSNIHRATAPQSIDEEDKADGSTTQVPTIKPTIKLTTKPTTEPTINPTTKPTAKPTAKQTTKVLPTTDKPVPEKATTSHGAETSKGAQTTKRAETSKGAQTTVTAPPPTKSRGKTMRTSDSHGRHQQSTGEQNRNKSTRSN